MVIDLMGLTDASHALHDDRWRIKNLLPARKVTLAERSGKPLILTCRLIGVKSLRWGSAFRRFDRGKSA
jgi:hypothetical protein